MTLKQSYWLLALSAITVYAGTLYHHFHFDDTITILFPSRIRDMEHFFGSISELSIRPILLFTFKLNYAIHEFNPVGYHVFNILLHAGNTILVFEVFVLLGIEIVPAFFGSLFFAVHPIQTQSVTYLSCRSVLLATFFYLLACRSFIKKQCIAVGVCFVLGMLSKEIVISLPFTLLLIDWYLIGGTFLEYCRRYKWFLLAVVSCFLLVAGYRLFYRGGILPTSQTPWTTWQYFVTEMHVIPFYYLQKVIMPWGLSVDPDSPIYNDMTPQILIFLGLVLISIWFGNSLQRLGILMFFMAILPESSVVPLLDFIAEHRMYLPMVGIALLVASVVSLAQSENRKRAFAMIYIALMIVLGVMSIERNKVWATEITLWEDARNKAYYLIRPHNNLGHSYDSIGRMDLAEIEFKMCLTLNPGYTLAMVNLGNIYGKRGDFKTAEEYFRKALAIDGRMSEAWYNLGTVHLKMGGLGEALKDYEKAMELNQDNHEAWKNAGIVAYNLGIKEKSNKYLGRYASLNKPTKEILEMIEESK